MASHQKRTEPRKTSRPPAPRGLRALVFKLVLAVGTPALLLFALEAGLRLSGYGRDPRFFIDDEQPGILRSNPRFTETFFPASFGLKPVNFRLPEEKPPGSTRIFVLGESAAMGVPEPAFGVAAQVRARLRAAFPDESVEVYNLGVTAINSHAIVEIARQAVTLHPDLLVIYMGNNEVVGPFGANSVFTGATMSGRLAKANIVLRSSRTGQLLLAAAETLGRGARAFKDWRGMEMFAGRSVAADDPQLQTVYANFRGNLEEILDLAEAAGVKVVLSTVAVNVRDCAPFTSLHAPALDDARRRAFAQAKSAGVRALQRGDASGAVAGLREALAIDNSHAETHFALARALDQRGEVVEAQGHYQEALQLDALRFRADARINVIIRDAAQARTPGVGLVDAAAIMAAAPTATARAWFFEHVHLTWEGNAGLSRLLAEEAARALWGEAGLAARWPDDAAVAASVGFTGLGRHAQIKQMDGLTSRPPFTGQLTFAEDRARYRDAIAKVEDELEQPGAVALAVGVVDRAFEADPENPILAFQAAASRLRSGDAAGALAMDEILLRLQPPSGEQAVLRAYALMQLGRFAEAELILIESTRREPYYFQTYSVLAQLWTTTRDLAKARSFFADAVTRMPESRAVRLPLAQFCAQAGDAAAAEEHLRAVLRLVPDEEAALAPLTERYLRSNRVGDAERLMLAAFDYNPRSHANNARLVQHYAGRGDREKAVQFMLALADSGPVEAEFLGQLAGELDALGRGEEAEVARAQARSHPAAGSGVPRGN